MILILDMENSDNKDISLDILEINQNSDFNFPELNFSENKVIPEIKSTYDAESIKELQINNPTFANWWENSNGNFATSLRNALSKHGKLTQKQIDAAKRCISNINSNSNNKAQNTTNTSDPLALNKLVNSMRKAKKNGVKEPKMRLSTETFSFTVSFEDKDSKYKNALRILDDDNKYLGRILGNNFYKSNYVSEEVAKAIVDVCLNPDKSAITYGKKTGNCSCCGRLLNNHESVKLGIGPVCLSKFF